MGDGLHYWDFPEGSDQYFWRRDKALHPGWDGDAIRNYQAYWRPLLDKLPEGPSLVTNTYSQDMKNWDMSETAPCTVAPSLNLSEPNTSLVCERKYAGTKDHGDGNFTENRNVNHVNGQGCEKTHENTRTQSAERLTENPDVNHVKGYQVCERREEDARTHCEDSVSENPGVNHVKDYQVCERKEEDASTHCEDSVTEKLDVENGKDQSLLSHANYDGIKTDSLAFGICMCAGF